MQAKIVQVGNSKGVRLPKRILMKYGFGEFVIIKEVDSGILIQKRDDEKLSWKETYESMAKSDEDWSDWADLDLEDFE